MDHGIEPFHNTNQMVENLDLITNIYRNLQIEDRHEDTYHHLPDGKPGAASVATYDVYDRPLQTNEKEDDRDQVYEPMVQTPPSRETNHHDLPENIEVDRVGFEEDRQKGEKRIDENITLV